jgi:hypothetical protein
MCVVVCVWGRGNRWGRATWNLAREWRRVPSYTYRVQQRRLQLAQRLMAALHAAHWGLKHAWAPRLTTNAARDSAGSPFFPNLG